MEEYVDLYSLREELEESLTGAVEALIEEGYFSTHESPEIIARLLAGDALSVVQDYLNDNNPGMDVDSWLESEEEPEALAEPPQEKKA